MEDYSLGESAGQGEDAYGGDLGPERAPDEEEDVSAALYLAEEETGGSEGLSAAWDENEMRPGGDLTAERIPDVCAEEELQARPVVCSNIVQDEGDFYSEQTHKGTLEALAHKAWSSAAPAQTPKNNKAGFKFAPSLKKTDRNDSTGSLGRLERTIEAVGIAAVGVAASASASASGTAELELLGHTNSSTSECGVNCVGMGPQGVEPEP
jgi:hypothetical protein